jgi:5-methylcytosine-specific restriction endonuclease McrA
MVPLLTVSTHRRCECTVPLTSETGRVKLFGRMKLKAKCHPKRFELFSYKTAHSWERGLCATCCAKASKTRVAVREKINRRLGDAAALRGPRSTRLLSSPGVSLTDFMGLIQVAGGACMYCRKPSAKLTLSYIVPLSRGGKDQLKNALPICPRCVNCKGRRLITEWPAARTIIPPAMYELLEKRTALFLSGKS